MSGLALFRALKFLTLENFLTAEECARVRAVMTESPSETAMVYVDTEGTADENIRRTRSVNVPRQLRSTITRQLDSVRDRAAQHFGVELSRTEGPQFLLYRPGDFFTRHTDNHSGASTGRQVSFIAFLNSDFEGGALKFYGGVQEKPLELTLDAQDGLLVFFRSGWFHEVEPVTSGMRFTIVGWFA